MNNFYDELQVLGKDSNRAELAFSTAIDVWLHDVVFKWNADDGINTQYLDLEDVLSPVNAIHFTKEVKRKAMIFFNDDIIKAYFNSLNDKEDARKISSPNGLISFIKKTYFSGTWGEGSVAAVKIICDRWLRSQINDDVQEWIPKLTEYAQELVSERGLRDHNQRVEVLEIDANAVFAEKKNRLDPSLFVALEEEDTSVRIELVEEVISHAWARRDDSVQEWVPKLTKYAQKLVSERATRNRAQSVDILEIDAKSVFNLHSEPCLFVALEEDTSVRNELVEEVISYALARTDDSSED